MCVDIPEVTRGTVFGGRERGMNAYTAEVKIARFDVHNKASVVGMRDRDI